MVIRRIHIIIITTFVILLNFVDKTYEEKICVVPRTTFKQVALTFDDGPHPGYTQSIVKILNQFNVKATFFLVGKQVERYPWLVRYIIENSDSKIGNHTYSHKNLKLLTTQQIEEELLKTHKLLCERNDTLDKIIPYFRPPGGHFDTRVLSTAEKLGFKMVLWSVFTNDHSPAITKEQLLNTIKKSVTSDKEIILLHSGSKATLEALPEIISFLKANDYKFVTVDEILNDETYYVN